MEDEKHLVNTKSCQISNNCLKRPIAYRHSLEISHKLQKIDSELDLSLKIPTDWSLNNLNVKLEDLKNTFLTENDKNMGNSLPCTLKSDPMENWRNEILRLSENRNHFQDLDNLIGVGIRNEIFSTNNNSNDCLPPIDLNKKAGKSILKKESKYKGRSRKMKVDSENQFTTVTGLDAFTFSEILIIMIEGLSGSIEDIKSGKYNLGGNFYVFVIAQFQSLNDLFRSENTIICEIIRSNLDASLRKPVKDRIGLTFKSLERELIFEMYSPYRYFDDDPDSNQIYKEVSGLEYPKEAKLMISLILSFLMLLITWLNGGLRILTLRHFIGDIISHIQEYESDRLKDLYN